MNILAVTEASAIDSVACSSIPWMKFSSLSTLRALLPIRTPLPSRNSNRVMPLMIALLLSSYSNVGYDEGKSSSIRMDSKYEAILAASIAAMTSRKPYATAGPPEQAIAMASTCRDRRTTFPSIVPR